MSSAESPAGSAKRGRPGPGAREPPRRWFGAAGSARDDARAASLEAEAARLREENRRLRESLSPSAGVGEELMTLSGQRPLDALDDVAMRAMGLRDDLVEICRQLAQTAMTLQTRLRELTPDAGGPAAEQPPVPGERSAS